MYRVPENLAAPNNPRPAIVTWMHTVRNLETRLQADKLIVSTIH